jgi:hypothetical protein
MVSKGDKLYLVGDSLAVGLNRHLRHFAGRSGIGYDSSTKSGTMTPYWTTAAFASRLATAKPNVVLVSLGTNDSASQRSDAKHRQSIQKLLQMISHVGAEAFWVLPPKLPTLPRSKAFSALVRAENVPVFESAQIDIPMGPDSIHPTGAGYAGWAGLVFKAITCGDSQPQPLSGPAPVVTQQRPRTTLAKPLGVFGKSRRSRHT